MWGKRNVIRSEGSAAALACRNGVASAFGGCSGRT